MQLDLPSLRTLLSWLVAAAGLALASQVEIPLRPVPITLQSLAVILVGFLLGPRSGFVATAIWLAAGAAGLPVFSDGEGGVEHLTGPTAGYLLAFPFAAALAGYGAAQLRSRGAGVRLFLIAITAHLIILAAGAIWLSTKIGVDAALKNGVLPFLPGGTLKSAAAAVLTILVRGGRLRTR